MNGFPKQKRDFSGLGLCGALVQHTPELPRVFDLVALQKEGEQVRDKAELFRLYKESEKNGELFKLQATIIPHYQGGNGNFWRIMPKAYAKIAKSFSGQVFQRDHWVSQKERGGTILSSRANGSGDDAFMEMALEVVEPWAIEGFLRGSIDRFSIQLNMLDLEAYCSICGANIMETYCGHYPGRSYEVKGEEMVCWWDVYAGSGKEVSAVSDPAVAGTRIEDIQQLAASMRGLPQPSEEDDMNIEELQALLASKEEEISAAQKEMVALKAAREAAESAKAQAETARQKAEADLAATLAASDALRSRVCDQILAQVQEIRTSPDHKILFAKDAPETVNKEAHPANEMERLERVLLADKILIEREARNFGTDFDVQTERQKLLAQPPTVLSFALEQIRATALPKVEPPMGRGAPFLPEGDKARVEMPPEPKASKAEEFGTFSVEEITALATGQADYRR